MAGRFSVEAVFKAVDRVTRPVSRMQTRVSKFTRSMSRNFSKLNRTVGKFTQGIKSTAIAAAAALAITAGAITNVIGVGVEFEQTLVNAAAKFSGEIRRGTEAFEDLERAARKTGATTEFTATQSAQALNFLAMAGFSAEAAIAALPGVVDLATTAQIDLGLASDIATDSLGAFNLLTKDAAQNQKNLTRITDVFAKATTSANLSIEEMFEAIKQGGPVGIAAGQSLETIATFAAKMADAGIKGTRAGTGLKNVFLSLNAPGSQAAKIMRALGIKTADASGNIRDAIDVFQDFARVTKKLPQQTQLKVFNEIFGKIPIAAAINLTNAAGGMKEFRQTLIDSTSTAKTMAGVMRDTVQGRLNSLKSAVEGVKISIFSLNRGPLSDAIDKMVQWTRANEDLIATNVGEFMANLITNFDDVVRIGKQVAGVTVAYIALTAALKLAAAASVIFNIITGTIAITLGLVKGGILAFGLIMAGLPKILALARIAMLALNIAFAANPVGLVVTAIAAFIALAAVVITAWDPVTEFFSDLGDKISGVVKGIGGALKEFGDFFGFTEKAPEAANTPAITTMNRADQEDQENASQTFSGTIPPQIISPQERIARQIDEQRTTSTAEVTIIDETGKAEKTSGEFGKGVVLQSSGAF